ncbi:zinc metalloprotease HtpX [Sulfurihydrogenibium azorense]|jgi:heat shock protein HtpX|uniref:Protease HtpX homolog n=1 Tax=Sulfurihydrogenibium azorense (strain DSM 15241 / OCM 825 / Az-Fu1) TaxID=204536 RepID=C1DVL9_SULAA|nr:zinc metalloprotease HtpX [Sulfurihydrogenibium azorense]ACN99731.1 putative protease HtpX homolog [Sulfurihydrogenibium azorense Az-Fu1]MDM7274344.1 zinc metalloprotease HtpX [Sulfurihydrogenibium azorense]
MVNQLKTVLLLGVLTGMFLAIGHLVAGKQGMIIAFVVALIMNFFAYFFSDKMALAMYGAREIPYEEAPWLHQMVEELARKAGIPKPKIYLAPIHVPNAFATGRDPDHAAVAVTSGILQILNKDELRGVLAHELGHIKNRDILISSIAATIGGAISMLANMAYYTAFLGGRDEENNNIIANIIGSIILFIVAPLAATLIQMAISRSREFIADETGAKISGCPLCLANALRKLEEIANNPQLQQVATQEVNPGTAHMMIVNPLRADTIMKLFSTHPPTEERIRRLEELARKMSYGYSFA